MRIVYYSRTGLAHIQTVLLIEMKSVAQAPYAEQENGIIKRKEYRIVLRIWPDFLVEWLVSTYGKRKNKSLFHFGVFFIVIFVPLTLLVVNFFVARSMLSDLAVEKREALAHAISLAAEERLHGLVNLNVSFATRPLVTQGVRAGNWDEAIHIVNGVTEQFSFIQRAYLVDMKGVVRADSKYPEMIGQSRADRDWYKEVVSSTKPSVSGVYKSVPVPTENVIAIAAPIRGEGEPIGILVLVARVNTFFEWTQLAELQHTGSVYIIDQSGQIVASPTVGLSGEVEKFEEGDILRRVQANEEGVRTVAEFEGEGEHLVAYEPVRAYDWGVVIAQPIAQASAARDGYLRVFYGLSSIALCVMLFAAYAIVLILRFSLEELQREKLLLEDIGEGVVVIDRNWHVTLFNEGARRMLGWDEAEVVGKPLRLHLVFLEENSRSEEFGFIEDVMVKGESKTVVNNLLLKTKEGEEVRIVCHAAPLFSSEENTKRVMGAVINFREAEKGRGMDLTRSDFAYAQHQLRTPITKALWNIESAMESGKEEDVRRNIAIAHDSLRSASETIDEFIELLKVEQKRVIPEISKVRVNEVRDSVLQVLESLRKKSSIEISISSDPPVVDLRTDPRIFGRVIHEIVKNALYYSEPNGKVSLSVKKSGAEVLVEVRDRGIGIPEREQVLVFTKFFRGSNVDTTKIPGSGLGLCIAKEYAALLGGKIWFESKTGEGTVFYVSISDKGR